MSAHISFPLLNDNPTNAKSREIAELVINVTRQRRDELARIHAGGVAAVDEAIGAGVAYDEASAKADVEGSESIAADAVSAALNQRAFDHLTYLYTQLRSIVPELPPEQAKAVRGAYGISSRHLSLQRVGNLRVLIEKGSTAHTTYEALLLSWGVPKHRIDETGVIFAQFHVTRGAAQKENNDAEAANLLRDAAEARFYKLMNVLLRRVLAMQADYPEVAKAFASTINKYAADLNPPDAIPDEPSADPA
jgi:hypothetical protein